MHTSPAPRIERVSIPVVDAGAIGATVTLPTGTPEGVLVVHPATATPERFYASFAAFAAGRGLAVITYDYRGTGGSGHPREHRDIRMRDWMRIDVPAVADYAATRYPTLPQYALGHSIGGHALVMGNGTARLDRILLVASHLAATRSIPARAERLRVNALLRGVGPALARVRGYVAASRVGLGEDIPSAAMLEWSAWSRLPRYFYDDPSMEGEARAADVTTPVRVVGATDDPWATRAQIEALVAPSGSRDISIQMLSPAELGVGALGHHGLMRRGVGEASWPQMLDWLLS